MRLLNLVAVHCALHGIVKGAPADDMESLSESCENATAVLNASLNNTMAMVRHIMLHRSSVLTSTSEYLRFDPEHRLASWCINIEPGHERTCLPDDRSNT
jgi:hypothetical protein